MAEFNSSGVTGGLQYSQDNPYGLVGDFSVQHFSTLGGQSSLGGAGWKQYMKPGALNFQNTGSSSQQQGVIPVPTGAAWKQQALANAPKQGEEVPKANAATDQAAADESKKPWYQKWNESSSDQWDKFTGSGKYDASNPANKANIAKNGMSFSDKLQAGMGLAAVVANAFG